MQAREAGAQAQNATFRLPYRLSTNHRTGYSTLNQVCYVALALLVTRLQTVEFAVCGIDQRNHLDPASAVSGTLAAAQLHLSNGGISGLIVTAPFHWRSQICSK